MLLLVINVIAFIVFTEKIEAVSLHTWPNDAVEGNGRFTLYYTTVKGEAEEVQWFLNGAELQNGSHYSMSGKNLSIVDPNRLDAGLYNVTLRNPFSFGTSERNVTVLCECAGYGFLLPRGLCLV